MKAVRISSKDLLRRFGVKKTKLDYGPSYPSDELTITIPLPPRQVRPNFHGHWALRARAVKLLRELSAALIRLKLRGGREDGTFFQYACPMWEKASVSIVWMTKTTKAMKGPPIDPDNALASMKAVFDGAQEAGLIRNDRNLWPERPVIDMSVAGKSKAGVVVTFRREEPTT